MQVLHPIIISRYGKPDRQRNAPGIAHTPSTSITAGRLLRLGAVLAALLGTLLLVATARAEPVTSPPTEATVPVSEPPPGTTGEAPQEPVAPVSEPPQETSVPVSEPPAETAAPVSETPLETSSPVTETVAETVVPVKEAEAPASPIVERETPTPVVPVIERVIEVTSPVQPTGAQAQEAGLGASNTSGSSEASSLLAAAAPQGGASPPSDPSTPAALAGDVMVVAPPGAGEPSTSTVKVVTTVPPLHLSAAQRAEDLSCQLSGLSGSASGDCTARWYATEGLASASATFVAGATPTTGSGAPPAGGYGGSSGGSRTMEPPPGPAPSGAFGGSAAGGSGIALSGFFTLAGLLLMAAPLAMRRLRLSCRPWLTAFFVLIPERPG
jgi:DNA polymerase-3 subunit gamma/tau